MAITDVVTPSREILRVGEVSYKRPITEAVFTRIAAQNNFINYYQNDCKEWKLNGSYSVATGITFFDGVTSFFYNSEIVGLFFYNGIQGASGTTQFDVIWKNASGVDQGSIFSVKPAIASTAAANTIGFKNLVTGTTVTPTGVTNATLSKTTFLEGESLYLVLDSAMVSAWNCGLTIYFRPVN